MWKSKFAVLAAAALLSLSFVVSAETYVAVQVKTWDVYAVHDLYMPTLRAADFSEPAATVATYEMQANVSWVDTPRVFRDFRTIADSGGRQA